MRPRAAAAALVEEQDVVARGIEQAAVIGRAAGARAPVEENGWFAVRVAAELPIDVMALARAEMTGLIGLDDWIEGAEVRYQKLISS